MISSMTHYPFVLFLVSFLAIQSIQAASPVVVVSGGDFVPQDSIAEWWNASKNHPGKPLILDPALEKDSNLIHLQKKYPDAERLVGYPFQDKAKTAGGQKEIANAIEKASAVWISATKHEEVAALLENKEVKAVIQKKAEAGVPLLFNGAAADFLSTRYFPEGVPIERDRFLKYPTQPGIDILNNSTIDAQTMFHSQPEEVLRFAGANLNGRTFTLSLPERTAAVLKEGKVFVEGFSPVPEYQALMGTPGKNGKGILLQVLHSGESTPVVGLGEQIQCTPTPNRVNPAYRAVVGGMFLQEDQLKPMTDWIKANPKKQKVLLWGWGIDIPNEEDGDGGYTQELLSQGIPESQIDISPTLKELNPPHPNYLNNRAILKAKIESAGAILFSGGDQNRYMDFLEANKDIRDAFEKRLKEGMPYGGASAGSTVTAAFTFTGNETSYERSPYEADVRKGLNLAHRVVIDSHFIQRPSRLSRLMGSLNSEFTHGVSNADMGIGLTPDTAIVSENGKMRVIGKEPAYVIHRLNPSTYWVRTVPPGQEIPLESCKLKPISIGTRHETKPIPSSPGHE